MLGAISMNKKSLFLIVLLSASQCQALWEIPAAFLMGMFAKTPMGQKVTSLIFSRCQKAWLSRMPSAKIQNIVTSNTTIQSSVGSRFAFLGSVIKGIASKSHGAMNASLIAFGLKAQNLHIKNPFVNSAEQSTTEQTHIQWASYHQPHVSYDAQEVKPVVNNFVKVDSQAQTLNQSTSGFFPRTTNNYYCGAPADVAAESGKKQFWKGVGVGGFTMGTTMAWLHSKQEHKK